MNWRPHLCHETVEPVRASRHWVARKHIQHWLFGIRIFSGVYRQKHSGERVRTA